MVTAIILLNAKRDKINTVAEALAGCEQISEVFSVSGSFDLVAIVRVVDNDALAQLVTEQMLKLEGITHSETMLAFRAYSRHDLESMFSLGVEL
ncbi:MAG TPA: Lrp/AsnC family transcriptional regulator [Gammaproteobacteria bacterium]|nr:Lrp/AsnC family transcriptional regulator [Gammaproteobacteria bacterium]